MIVWRVWVGMAASFTRCVGQEAAIRACRMRCGKGAAVGALTTRDAGPLTCISIKRNWTVNVVYLRPCCMGGGARGKSRSGTRFVPSYHRLSRPQDPGRIVAELPFGVWGGLTGSGYSRLGLWNRHLHRAFPNAKLLARAWPSALGRDGTIEPPYPNTSRLIAMKSSAAGPGGHFVVWANAMRLGGRRPVRARRCRRRPS